MRSSRALAVAIVAAVVPLLAWTPTTIAGNTESSATILASNGGGDGSGGRGDDGWRPSSDSRRHVATDATATATATTTADGHGGGDVQGRSYAVHEPNNSNDSDVDAVVEQILRLGREGRRLVGDYDQVYADGNVDQALMLGDEGQARNLVRDKLCGLGLMQCSGGGNAEKRRPHYSTIYAQGPPPPPPRLPPLAMNLLGPPRKIGYEGGSGGLYAGPSYRPTDIGPIYMGPPTYVDGVAAPPPSPPSSGIIVYGSKPPGPVFSGDHNHAPPYKFESATTEQLHGADSQISNSFYSQRPAIGAAGATTTGASLQQHVHHHYHHVEGGDHVGGSVGGSANGVKVPSVAINAGPNHVINTGFSSLAQSSAVYSPPQVGPGSSYTPAAASGIGGFSLTTGNGQLLAHEVGRPHLRPTVGAYKPLPSNLNGYGGGGVAEHSSYLGYGQAAGVGSSYHSSNPNYVKKELHKTNGLGANHNTLNGLSGGYGGVDAGVGVGVGAGSSYGGSGYEVSRQQFVDCHCVPLSQCPTADRIGRKEDLLLPIDPRHLAKDIEALSDEGTATAATNATATIQVRDATGTATATGTNEDSKRPKREVTEVADDEPSELPLDAEGRAYYGKRPLEQSCHAHEVCCRRPVRPQQQPGRCGVRNAAGITGRIKNPVYVDGDSEFGEYPWHVAILKKDVKESIYACGGTLIDGQHVITAAHCIKSQNGFDLRARLGEWDVNHDVEFFPYVERDIIAVHIHPEYYAGTLDNDLAILRLDQPIDFAKSPHISPACLPDRYSDFTGARCWTTGWGKDAFGEHGKYQNILKEVDVPVLSPQTCQNQLRQTRLGYNYKLNAGFLCAGGEEGKDACKGDGGGPLVCDHNGIWNVIGVVSWGIGCGQANVPGVYVRVAHYLDWIQQITQYFK